MYFKVFDCWRFAAALLVMIYHFLFWGPAETKAGIDFLYRLLPLLDMFFMISGFFITSRYASRLETLSDYGSFFRRRVARLYPLHVLTTMFFVAVALFAFANGAQNYPWRSDFELLPYALFGLHALGFTDTLGLNYVTWSVSAEFFSYAMFPLIVLALRWRGTAGLAALVAVYLTGLEIASSHGVFPSGHWTTADTMGAYRAFADFMIGGLLARLVARSSLALTSPLPGIAFMACAVIAMMALAPWYVSFGLIIVSLYLSALAETRAPDSTRAIAFVLPVTAASFSIYIWHPVFEFFFLRVLWDRWLAETGSVNFYAFMILPMILTILVGVLSVRFLEPRLAHLVAGPRPAGTPRTGAVPTT
ncbi:acyltransferase family protein [Fulvimarina endophytica]|uniref:acyltransferase family protein n=1 Tax=Fulvimarina endophytica TaxID=2293836 RepID=UPI001FE17B13|nr:acyltransferase [Fulvimarina endophytica]